MEAFFVFRCELRGRMAGVGQFDRSIDEGAAVNRNGAIVPVVFQFSINAAIASRIFNGGGIPCQFFTIVPFASSK